MITAGKGGIEMVGGDGDVRKVYPLLCTYVADYPEQCLVTCTKYGTCPKCQRKANDLGLASAGDSRTVLWTLGIMKEAHDTSVANQEATPGQDSNSTQKSKNFPLTDIHDCMTPDILHQCYQGVFKHLLKCVQEIVVLPPTCGVRHFKKGIADFSQVTGTEHKHIACILIASLTGKVDQRGIAYFVKQQTTKDQINIPKFHSLLHYVNPIKWLGTTDNYNTEAFERFHVDMAKEAWDATNKRNHFHQMTQWLSRQEKILSFGFYRNWIDSTSTNQGAQKNDITLKLDVAKLGLKKRQIPNSDQRAATATPASTSNANTKTLLQTNIRIAKHPHETKKSLNAIANSHNAPGFIPALKLYINSLLPKEGQMCQKK
ncbi:hypothetical protein BDP27DRAFT_1386850 [Rhodocollybia butyracea]|uniref:Uncharacterized protein n=1 Tax=Rhodocollybia butyracea TaxID=206335 RepID=A0A9P5P455_9AGAR|nr:hypothetical protein BDP27DRAFT_1386850 [Rhodocollybia butyracea]